MIFPPVHVGPQLLLEVERWRRGEIQLQNMVLILHVRINLTESRKSQRWVCRLDGSLNQHLDVVQKSFSSAIQGPRPRISKSLSHRGARMVP